VQQKEELIMARLPRNGYLLFTFGLLSLASALLAEPTGHPTGMIRGAVDESKTVTLAGNTRPEANATNDRGIVSDEFPMGHMMLQLKRSPEREAALQQYIEELHDAQSPNFHKWLTAEQFAEHYGVAKSDVDTVTSWLKMQGFTVHGVEPNGLRIDFSGTAGMVRKAYHTEIHNLEVNGVKHIANMSDPKIPAALEPAVVGVVSLNNFHPTPMLLPRHQYTYLGSFGPVYALVPGDIATIYNLNPVFAAGYTGKGETIMVLEDTYVYSTNDWATFRQTFGLTTQYPFGSLKQVSPQGPMACTNPGLQGPGDPGYGDDAEAALDVEWSTAAAPNAAIVLAACTDTYTTFGGLTALINVLNGPAASLPSVVSMSYGLSEVLTGPALNYAFNSTFQQGVAEGVSIFVSSGDENAASQDHGNVATHGISISGWTSSPYDVSVGGLDFGYTANNVIPSTYWSSTNGTYYNSALSYIQEIPWNNSCAGGLLASFFGLTPPALCNNPNYSGFLDAVGGSGGPSGCATGSPTITGVVSGTCAGYPKPSWQKGLLGNPSDGVRDIPDVSLFASNGFWNSYYVACWTNPTGGFPPCNSVPPSGWSGWGGTSISSPIMAGIQALIDQKTGAKWGNPNPVYYALAKAEYATSGRTSYCNSNTVPKIGNICIFYDITQGDNDSVCQANANGIPINCAIPPGNTYGVLSTTSFFDEPAYLATPGWDFTSGIGSVNAWYLLNYWPPASQ
jgi:subtilase family serine protease